MGGRSHPINNKATLSSNEKNLTFIDADGTQRHFKRVTQTGAIFKGFALFYGEKFKKRSQYILKQEILPNGHIIQYEWKEVEKNVIELKKSPLSHLQNA